MQEKYTGKYDKMMFKVMDVLDMSEFEDGNFDFILDKGTLDCIVVTL